MNSKQQQIHALATAGHGTLAAQSKPIRLADNLSQDNLDNE